MNLKRQSTYDTVLIAVWAAMTFAVKFLLTPVAGVELVSLMLCVFTVVMGFRRGILAALAFTTITVFESTYYGAGDWIILYYINWPLLSVLSTSLLRGNETKELRAAVLLGGFGLLFDIPSALLKLLFFGPVYALTYLISGIPYDVVHGAVNFITGLFLYQPLCKALKRIKEKLFDRAPR